MTKAEFMDKLGTHWVPEPITGCWLWFRANKGSGYGTARVNGHTVQAHRLAYELIRGPIPDGLTIDHLCRTACCVNPDHMEPVTHRENTLRGIGRTAQNARKTHCNRGHELSPENTYLQPGRPRERTCKTCRGTSSAAWNKRSKYRARKIADGFYRATLPDGRRKWVKLGAQKPLSEPPKETSE